MGDWYVIAHIPSWPEREAFDAVESYALKPDGRIQTTFTYRGSFDAPQSMHPIGRVEKEGNGAIWGMQFIWPIQAEYVIAWLDDDYGQTIVARSKRDYVWFMARTPQGRQSATTSRQCSVLRPWVTTPESCGACRSRCAGRVSRVAPP